MEKLFMPIASSRVEILPPHTWTVNPPFSIPQTLESDTDFSPGFTLKKRCHCHVYLSVYLTVKGFLGFF